MAQRPSHPQSGQQLSARWGRQLLDWIETIRPKGDHATTKVSPEGYISAFGAEAAAAATTHNGLWAITDKGDNLLDIAAGRVINGTASTAVAAETDFNVEANDFLYLEISYDTSYTIEYKVGATYPDQDKKDGAWCLRCLIGEKVDSVWKQRRWEEIHNTRSAE